MHIAFLQSCGLFCSRRPLLLQRSPFRPNYDSASRPLYPFVKPQCVPTRHSVVMGSFRNHLSALAATVSLILLPASSIASVVFQPTQSQHQSSVRSGSLTNHPKHRKSVGVILPTIASEAPKSTKPEALQPDAPSVLKTPQKQSPEPNVSELSRVGLGSRFSFYISEFLMWHPSAKIVTLFSFTLLAMYLGSFLYKFADPNREEAQYPFWHSVRAIAAPFEDNWKRNSLRATSITLAGFGMIVFAILVGMVTETVESAVQNADGEHTQVLVSDHIVICGWSPHVAQMIKDVNTVAPDVKVVVLAGFDQKQAIIEDIRSTLPDEEQNTVHVYYRPGDPTVLQDLERVNAAHAKKILLVNTRRGNPVNRDRVVLSRALALRQNLPSFQGDIIAELNSSRDESIVKSILHRSHASSVETINTEQLLFRFMAQAIRQPGLADVVSQLMGDDPMSIFHIASAKDSAPQLIGTYFSEIRPTSIPGAVICGFVDSNGIHIDNGPKYGGTEKIKSSTQFLLLGVTKSMRSIVVPAERKPFELSISTANIMQRFVENNSKAGKGQAESFLVLGWRQDMESMLQELDNILPKNSSVKIVDQNVPDKLYLPLKHVKVEFVRQRADRYECINSLTTERSKPYDHIIIIGSSVSDGIKGGSESNRNDDARTLATLVYVNDVLAKQKTSQNLRTDQQPLVTVEFLHEDVAEMAKEEGGVANAVLPQYLGSKVAAQTVRDSRLNVVWRELLSQAGREVYLRPVGAYPGFAGGRGSFASVADRLAKSSNDIMIGYIPRYMPKVKINPQETERFSTRVWDENDTLIVLSKE